MEETFISFVSSCFLEADHETHNRTSEEDEVVEVEAVGELLCDFVPYAHDGYVPLRDRAFSWDVSLEHPLTDVPHLAASLITTTDPKQTATSSGESHKLVIKTSKRSLNSNSHRGTPEESTRTSMEADEEYGDDEGDERNEEIEEEEDIMDAEDDEERLGLFDETIMVINDGLHALSGYMVKSEHLADEPSYENSGTPRGGNAASGATGGSQRSRRKSTQAKLEQTKGSAALRTPDSKQQETTQRSNRKGSNGVSRSSSVDLGTSKANGGSSSASKSGRSNSNANSSMVIKLESSKSDSNLAAHNTNSSQGGSNSLVGNGHTILNGGQASYKPPSMKSSLTSIMNSYTALTTTSGILSSTAMHADEVFRIAPSSSSSSSLLGMGSSSMIGDSERRVGQYTVEERRMKIEKFRERKRQRIWRKQIKYDCRKRLADNRPRVKGRFVSRKNLSKDGPPGGLEEDDKMLLMGDDDDVEGLLIPDNESDGESVNATTPSTHLAASLSMLGSSDPHMLVVGGSGSHGNSGGIVVDMLHQFHHNNGGMPSLTHSM